MYDPETTVLGRSAIRAHIGGSAFHFNNLYDVEKGALTVSGRRSSQLSAAAFWVPEDRFCMSGSSRLGQSAWLAQHQPGPNSNKC